MMKNFTLICVGFFFMQGSVCFAEEQQSESARPTIFETLTDNSDLSKGVVTLHQDEKIKELVYRKKESDAKSKTFATAAGFRVQVFSSNESHTGKANAYKTEEKIKERFPEMTVYVSYLSPFWKVRVGDCLSNAEAQGLRDQIKKEFPELQQEIYIVKDQVLVPEE
ncbi:MAG: SPOR domain-containing protein [Paludibacteraceae bacterium]|nr:SPOR domain-containing protein [Paludibacteraceae bacterium]